MKEQIKNQFRTRTEGQLMSDIMTAFQKSFDDNDMNLVYLLGMQVYEERFGEERADKYEAQLFDAWEKLNEINNQ